MSAVEYPFILGTAGHIDHGKTTLVRALTGVDCDRLIDEKKRGITIELGFAPLLLPSGRTVSIIDVPGHEKFIRQMVAGAAGVDAVMLVVAADEGVMPQTREHIEILSLLGIKHGFIALTKCDLVDHEMIELASSDAHDIAKGTFLEGARAIPVSSTTGEGVEEVRAHIEEIVDTVKRRERSGAFFMPIDRAFTIKGFGSVVTGTSFHGSIGSGEEVEILPRGLKSKIRSIQIHGAPAERADAGTRTALNLASISLDDLARGDVVCAAGRFSATSCIDVSLEMLESASAPLKHWQRVHLHVGTSDVLARVALLSGGKNDAVAPGERCTAQLVAEEDIACANGARFVIRSYSPVVTIGGGQVLIANASRPNSARERDTMRAVLDELAGEWSAPMMIKSIVELRGCINEKDIASAAQMDPPELASAIKRALKLSPDIMRFAGERRYLMTRAVWDELCAAALDALNAHHESSPEMAGLDIGSLRSAIDASMRSPHGDVKDTTALIESLAQEGAIEKIASDGSVRYAAPGFVPSGGDKFDEMIRKFRDAADSAGFELPTIPEMSSATGFSHAEMDKVLRYMREHEGMRNVGDMLFTKEMQERALDALRGLEGDITPASYRDKIGASRKYALAVLEFFDASGITRRVGEKRIVIGQS